MSSWNTIEHARTGITNSHSLNSTPVSIDQTQTRQSRPLVNMADKVKKTVKDTTKQELNEIQRVTKDGAKSGAYLYPIKVSITYVNASNTAD